MIRERCYSTSRGSRGINSLTYRLCSLAERDGTEFQLVRRYRHEHVNPSETGRIAEYQGRRYVRRYMTCRLAKLTRLRQSTEAQEIVSPHAMHYGGRTSRPLAR